MAQNLTWILTGIVPLTKEPMSKSPALCFLPVRFVGSGNLSRWQWEARINNIDNVLCRHSSQEVSHPIPPHQGVPPTPQKWAEHQGLGESGPEKGRKPPLVSSFAVSFWRHAALHISWGVEGSYVRPCHCAGHFLWGQDTVSKASEIPACGSAEPCQNWQPPSDVNYLQLGRAKPFAGAYFLRNSEAQMRVRRKAKHLGRIKYIR